MSGTPPDNAVAPPPPPYPAAPPGSPYPGPGQYPAAPPVGPSGWRPAGPAPGVAYAGFWPRFLGYIIDAILLFVLEAIVSIPIIVAPIVRYYQAHPVVQGQAPSPLPADMTARYALVGLVGAVAAALYFGGLVAWQGRTLGQRAIGATVVRAEDGGALPPGRAFVRAAIFWAPGLLGLVPVIGWVAGLAALIGLLAVAWDPRKQGWHDKLGRSLVVKRTAY